MHAEAAESTYERFKRLHEPGDIPLAHGAFLAFVHAMRAQGRLMSRKIALRGMHPAQAGSLSELAHHQGITQRDLAERLGVARPTVTVMLKKMERADLVERRVDEQDQRYTRIYLTPAGMELHEEMHEVVAEIVEATIAPLSEDDQRELTRLLGLLTENIAAATDAVQAESDHSTLEMASDETEEDCEL